MLWSLAPHTNTRARCLHVVLADVDSHRSFLTSLSIPFCILGIFALRIVAGIAWHKMLVALSQRDIDE